MWGGGFVEIVVLPISCFLITLALIMWRWRKTDDRFPPGPSGLPIIGHLHLLSNLPHQVLREMSQKYGPILGLRLGQRPLVVVSSPALAKEVLSTHDKVFANRPPYDFTSNLFYQNDILFSFYGPQWRKQRKMCIVDLLTAKRLRELEYVRQEEMAALLQTIQAESEGGRRAIDVGSCVGHMSSSVLLRLLMSTPAGLVTGGENIHDLVTLVENVASNPTLGDYIPWLSCLDFMTKRRMQRTRARVDNVFNSVLAERKQGSSHHDDLLQALLSKLDDNMSTSSNQDTLTMHEIKGIMMDMMTAGIHTTALTIQWAMAELLRSPDCLHRLQREMETTAGGKKQLTDADVAKCGYLKCIVKEVFRLHPVVPLLLPRISTEQCKLNGYIIPANTLMSVNLWAMGRDEQVWPNATQFMPERFEGKDMDLKGQHYELLPFGSGRRVCLGLPLGLSVFEVTLANLVHSFDWELPSGETCESLNMDERTGLTVNKATPVIAIPKPRISST